MAIDLLRLPTDSIVRPDKDRFLNEENPFEAMMSRFDRAAELLDLTPEDIASRAHCSAATVAANGVDFFEPLNPAFPDVPHDTALPCASVMVISVLLNVALTCATPSASTTRFVFFPIAIT